MIDTIRRDDLLAHVREVGGYFLEQLTLLASKHDCIREVRGRGLMLGLELHSADHASAVATAMLDRRIIINRTSETVLRFLPPYILERVHVDQAITALNELLGEPPTLVSASASIPGESFHE